MNNRNKALRCYHCNGLMIHQHDRSVCSNCSRSIWREFTVRQPSLKDRTGGGGPSAGITLKGIKNVDSLDNRETHKKKERKRGAI